MDRINRTLFFLFLVFAFVCGPLQAVGLENLGLRPAGIGYAFTGLADDPSALFYNPAGLVDHKSQVSYENYDFNRLETAGQQGWLFGTGSLAYGQYFRQEKNGLLTRLYAAGVGLNIPGIGQFGAAYKKYDLGVSGTNWAWDLGFLKRNLSPGLNVGLVVRNALQQNYLTERQVRAGFSYFMDPNNLAVVDVESTLKDIKNIRGYQFFYGLESRSGDNTFYRMGWSRSGFSWGVTVNLSFIILEYAYVLVPETSNSIQSFAIKFTAES
jgi:hypothetical protein